MISWRALVQSNCIAVAMATALQFNLSHNPGRENTAAMIASMRVCVLALMLSCAFTKRRKHLNAGEKSSTIFDSSPFDPPKEVSPKKLPDLEKYKFKPKDILYSSINPGDNYQPSNPFQSQQSGYGESSHMSSGLRPTFDLRMMPNTAASKNLRFDKHQKIPTATRIDAEDEGSLYNTFTSGIPCKASVLSFFDAFEEAYKTLPSHIKSSKICAILSADFLEKENFGGVSGILVGKPSSWIAIEHFAVSEQLPSTTICFSKNFYLIHAKSLNAESVMITAVLPTGSLAHVSFVVCKMPAASWKKDIPFYAIGGSSSVVDRSNEGNRKVLSVLERNEKGEIIGRVSLPVFGAKDADIDASKLGPFDFLINEETKKFLGRYFGSELKNRECEVCHLYEDVLFKRGYTRSTDPSQSSVATPLTFQLLCSFRLDFRRDFGSAQQFLLSAFEQHAFSALKEIETVLVSFGIPLAAFFQALDGKISKDPEFGDAFARAIKRNYEILFLLLDSFSNVPSQEESPMGSKISSMKYPSEYSGSHKK